MINTLRTRLHLSRFRIIVFVSLLVAWPAHANVVGVDTQNFNPTNDGLDFITVQSSETLTPGTFNVGLFTNYAVNSLPNYEDTRTQTRTNFSDTLLSADFNFGVGLTHNWEAGISFPMLIAQTVNSDLTTFHGEFASTGLTEIRAMTKYRFFGDQDHGLGTVLSVNFNQIADDPFTGNGAGPTYNFELVGDMTFDRFAVGLNAGYRLRQPGQKLTDVPIEPFGDEMIASAAVSYLLTDYDTKLIGELFGSMPVKESQFESDRSASSAEFLLGLKTDITRSLAFHVGGGTEVVHGTASPDWRVYTGLNWVIGPLFSKPQNVIVRVEGKPLDSLDEQDVSDPFSGEPQLTESFVARDVLFEFNSDRLRPEAWSSLQKLVNYLKRPPGFKSLIISGHTDSIGSAMYNLNLSQRRASHVRDALVKLGLPRARIRAIGYGESRPIADNGNYQGRALNRRVEFQVRR